MTPRQMVRAATSEIEVLRAIEIATRELSVYKLFKRDDTDKWVQQPQVCDAQEAIEEGHRKLDRIRSAVPAGA